VLDVAGAVGAGVRAVGAGVRAVGRRFADGVISMRHARRGRRVLDLPAAAALSYRSQPSTK
jgi:hypothetical protein